ncbi:MAG: hypothetical protein V9G13_11215 [Marmoricola sp.]
MAKLLFRIGQFSARRPVLVVLAWLLAVLASGGAMTALQKPTVNTFTVPGSEFGRVLDHLSKTIPAIAGGSGTAVVQSDKPFTKAQREAIAADLCRLGEARHRQRGDRPLCGSRSTRLPQPPS